MDELVPEVADASAPELEATAAIEPVENRRRELLQSILDYQVFFEVLQHERQLS